MKNLIPSPKQLIVGVIGGLAAIWLASHVGMIGKLVYPAPKA